MTTRQAEKLTKAVTKSCGCYTEGYMSNPVPCACQWCIRKMLMDLKPPEPKKRSRL